MPNIDKAKIRVAPNLIFVDSEQKVDIFGPGSNTKRRYLATYETMTEWVAAIKALHLSIVYTAGVYDLIHHGHARYLEEARRRGNILILGVELDEAVKLRKGPTRPIVPFIDRIEMLSHIRHVDIIVPVLDYNQVTGLSGTKNYEIIRPDVVVASERSLAEDETTQEWLSQVSRYCGRIDMLKSQAETSSSNLIRNAVISHTTQEKQKLEPKKPTIELLQHGV